jgi:predicted ATP-grasp superfamily ATP-dependent carboligase
VYLSAFENDSAGVRALAAGRALWGNPPEVLEWVRNPMLVAAALRRRGLPALAVRVPRRRGSRCGTSRIDPRRLDRLVAPHGWLVKALASGGGRRVRPWRRGSRVPRGCYLQARAEGVPGSVVFAAAGGTAVPLGVSRQLVGDPAFGAAGYRYCGSLVAPADDPQFARGSALFAAAGALADAVAAEFGLVGVNGIDFVAADGVPYAVEINPRWSASMELVEHAFGISVFGAHADACRSARLPGPDECRWRRSSRAVGKAVVFARRAVTVGDTSTWLSAVEGTVRRDVPRPGEHIRAGGPVCTVLAEERDAASCHAALVAAAGRVYRDLAAWQREVA